MVNWFVLIYDWFVVWFAVLIWCFDVVCLIVLIVSCFLHCCAFNVHFVWIWAVCIPWFKLFVFTCDGNYLCWLFAYYVNIGD